MYSKTSIQTAAEGLVGWSASQDDFYDDIPSAFKASSSGYYVNDLPGVSVKLLNYITEDKGSSDYITRAYESSVVKVFDSFLAKQKNVLGSKELLSNVTMLQDYIDFSMPITQSGRFIGYAITPRESKSIVSTIQQVGFISSAPQSFTLYLFVTSKQTAVATKIITLTGTKSIEWTTLNWETWFDSEAYGAGQRYIIGYFEDQLSATLYSNYWTGSQAHFAQRLFGHYMGISPVRFNSSTLDGTNIPDVYFLVSSQNCQTSGFDLRFNCKCDITKVLVDNVDMFAEALQHQIAVKIISDALSVIELNNVGSAMKNIERWRELLTEYNGKLHGGVIEGAGYVPGIIDKLSLDFSLIDAVCLKNKKGEIGGVKW